MAKRLAQLVVARSGSEPLTQIALSTLNALNVDEETIGRATKLGQTGNVDMLCQLISEEIIAHKEKLNDESEFEEGSVESLLALASSAGRCLSALIDDREAAASYAKKLFL